MSRPLDKERGLWCICQGAKTRSSVMLHVACTRKPVKDSQDDFARALWSGLKDLGLRAYCKQSLV